MTKCLHNLFAIIVLASLITNSSADFTSPTYRSARQAYVNGDWVSALKLLKQYMAEDGSFLASSPTSREAVLRAIEYCNDKSTSSLIAGGVQTVPVSSPSPPPVLPNPDGPFAGQLPSQQGGSGPFGLGHMAPLTPCGCTGQNMSASVTPQTRCQSGESVHIFCLAAPRCDDGRRQEQVVCR